MGWDQRPPFERMMDEVAAATSVAEIEHLREEAHASFSDHSKFASLRVLLDAKRYLLLDVASEETKRVTGAPNRRR